MRGANLGRTPKLVVLNVHNRQILDFSCRQIELDAITLESELRSRQADTTYDQSRNIHRCRRAFPQRHYPRRAERKLPSRFFYRHRFVQSGSRVDPRESPLLN
jgi:hypothetical protein